VKRKKEHYIYILPSVIILAIIVIFPTIFLWYISFTNYDLTMGWENKTFVGFDNFLYLFQQDKDFWHSVKLSILFMVITVAVELCLGFLIALLFNREMRWKRLWIACLIVPMVMTPAIASLMWKLMLNTEYGVLNYILSWLSIPKINWLGYESAFLSLMIVEIWQWTPFMTLILYAGLQSLPREPFEAADVDGASFTQALYYITLPLLKPIIAIALLLRSIDALKIFDIAYGLTQGGPGNSTELMSLHIFRLGFRHTNWMGRASANAIILLLLAIPLVTVLSKSLKVSQREDS
jgi:multiple sugar transport system permease protein